MRCRIGQVQHPGGGARLQPVTRNRGAPCFDAIGALRHQRQGRTQRCTDTVTQHRHQLHGLAGAINATLGIEERIRRAGRGTTAHAAIRQVKGRTAQVQQVEIIGRAIGHHHHGLFAAGGAEKPAGEIGAAIAAGDRGCQHIVVAGHQRQAHARLRAGAAI